MQIQCSVLFTSLLFTSLVSYHHQIEYQPHKSSQIETSGKEIIAQNKQQSGNSRGDGRREEDREQSET